MDAETAERVSQLAHNLKKLHLAATMEEAFQRAKDIILGSTRPPEQEKSIGELDAEMRKAHAEGQQDERLHQEGLAVPPQIERELTAAEKDIAEKKKHLEMVEKEHPPH
jgi:hypothetical protein